MRARNGPKAKQAKVHTSTRNQTKSMQNQAKSKSTQARIRPNQAEAKIQSKSKPKSSRKPKKPAEILEASQPKPAKASPAPCTAAGRAGERLQVRQHCALDFLGLPLGRALQGTPGERVPHHDFSENPVVLGSSLAKVGFESASYRASSG